MNEKEKIKKFYQLCEDSVGSREDDYVCGLLDGMRIFRFGSLDDSVWNFVAQDFPKLSKFLNNSNMKVEITHYENPENISGIDYM